MVDENKIAFIVSNVNNSSLKRLKNFLSGCALPENFSLELNVVSTAGNKAEAYNKAMLKSTAKYKFYLDEYTVPLERDFIKRIISLFAGNSQIGLVGCLGITELPLNGILYEASREDVFGKCFVDNPKMLAQYAEFDGLYKEVQCVFGGLIATQYDVQWREDLFTDNANYFYVASQCIEFARNNYTVAVISQDEPLIWDRKADYSINDSDRQSFLKEYSADVFPLVSVIIPTFERPKFFKIALDSVLNQTYLNLDIMISDNSNDNRTEDLMQPYLARDKRIKYYHHRDFDRGGNWSFCRSYDNPKAEYVNWLMDDDLFAPRKIELMVDCYRKNPDVSLVFSNRLFIDAEGKIIKQHTVSENNFKMSGGRSRSAIIFPGQFYR